MTSPYDHFDDQSDTWTAARVAELWTFLRTLWSQLPVVAGEETAAVRTWQAMLDGLTPWEVGRAAWNLAEGGADRCPVVGVLANAAKAEAAADRPIRKPPPLTDDQVAIRDFLAGLLAGRAQREYPDDRFLLRAEFLDDYAAGRMALCVTIHADLEDAGLLPSPWRTVPVVTRRVAADG